MLAIIVNIADCDADDSNYGYNKKNIFCHIYPSLPATIP